MIYVVLVLLLYY